MTGIVGSSADDVFRGREEISAGCCWMVGILGKEYVPMTETSFQILVVIVSE